MKNRQMLEIHQAIQRLDGCPSEVNGHLIPYQFTGNTAYAIGKNISKILPLVKDIQSTYNTLLKAILKPGEKGLTKGDERIDALSEEYEKVLEIESEYIPYKFNLSGLNLNQNKISPSIIAMLDPLITDDSPPPISSDK
jgi:hypothetical protein